MEIIARRELQENRLPGRIIQKAVGKDARSRSGRMTMGFGHYSKKSGPMEPHQHAEEICYIIDARKGYIRYGDGKQKLEERIALERGMILHVPELEWHVFEYDGDGFVDIIFFYGQVDNIRPEEIRRNNA
jgi:hypothetical protein